MNNSYRQNLKIRVYIEKEIYFEKIFANLQITRSSVLINLLSQKRRGKKMKGANKVKLVFFYTLIIPVLIFLQGFFTNTLTSTYQSKGKWVAPESSNQLKNPITDVAAASKEGKKTYQTLCNVCHGDKGKGDGIAGAALTPKPSNLISEEVQKQSDGAIFWKITNGRPPMAPYKTALTEQQRWQLVTYIRSLSGK